MYKFCLSHSHFKHIDSTGYIPVGLGDNKFPNSWLRDNTGQNISDKNKYFIVGPSGFSYGRRHNFIK